MTTPSPMTPADAGDQPLKQVQVWGVDGNTFAILLHLSLFGGYLLPGAGFVLPVVMWLAGRHAHPELDAHGRVVINWLLSHLLWGAVFWALCIVLIGFPLLALLALLALVQPIMGAIWAADGRVRRYWLAVPFMPAPR